MSETKHVDTFEEANLNHKKGQKAQDSGPNFFNCSAEIHVSFALCSNDNDKKNRLKKRITWNLCFSRRYPGLLTFYCSPASCRKNRISTAAYSRVVIS